MSSRYSAGTGRQNMNPYAAGVRRYGPSGRSMPNLGPTSNLGGYRQRDVKARRNALLRKLQAQQSGAYASADAQRRK